METGPSIRPQPESRSTIPTKALLVGGLVVSAAAIWLLLRKKTKKTTSGGISESLEQEENTERQTASKNKGSSPISKQILIKIFEEITDQMENVIIQLANFQQKIMQDASQRGQQIPEQALAEHIVNQFEEAMKAIEQAVYEKHDTTEEEVKQAAEHFEEDADFAAVVRKLKNTYSMLSGTPSDEIEDIPDFLSLDKVLDVIEETMVKMTEAMEQIVKELRESGRLHDDGATDLVNQLYMRRVQEIRTEVHAKHGVNQELLQAAVLKYQNESRFAEKMIELSMMQRERFQKAGVAAMM